MVDTFQSSFRTRLSAGDPAPFSFAAYGDSAYLVALEGFHAVQGQINRSAADFAVLLGDNIYDSGRHDEADARYDASISPEAAQWTASYIDYYAVGNHETFTENGQPSRDTFAVPIPRAGVSAHVQPPRSEPPEHNYSFDYGYYQQVVGRLRGVGADLFLVGHSHTFSWTKPLFGQDDGVAEFIDDNDKRYDHQAGKSTKAS